GRGRRGHRGLPDPQEGTRRGLPAAAEPVRPPVQVRSGHPDHRPAPGHGRPEHRPLQAAARRGTSVMTVDPVLPRGDDPPIPPAPPGGGKPFAITLDVGSSLANKTGSWRTERPVYVDLMPPCNHACPAGENI